MPYHSHYLFSVDDCRGWPLDWTLSLLPWSPLSHSQHFCQSGLSKMKAESCHSSAWKHSRFLSGLCNKWQFLTWPIPCLYLEHCCLLFFSQRSVAQLSPTTLRSLQQGQSSRDAPSCLSVWLTPYPRPNIISSGCPSWPVSLISPWACLVNSCFSYDWFKSRGEN